jgi:arginyl-tRNA synthetase
VYFLYAIARMHSILGKVQGLDFVADALETKEECALVRK